MPGLKQTVASPDLSNFAEVLLVRYLGSTYSSRINFQNLRETISTCDLSIFNFPTAFLISFLDILPQLILSFSSISVNAVSIWRMWSIRFSTFENVISTCSLAPLLLTTFSHHYRSLPRINLLPCPHFVDE